MTAISYLADVNEIKTAPCQDNVSFTLRGWHNPTAIPIAIRRACIPALREGIQRDLAALIPRCEALDARLPQASLNHRGYVSSKIHRSFPLDIGRAIPSPRGVIIPRPVSREPRIRLDPVIRAADSLAVQLNRVQSGLIVGEVTDHELSLLARRYPAHLAPGNGLVTITRSGRARPGADSFSAWMANHDEAERASIGAIILGRSAGPADIELLRGRVHAHQPVIIEAGSAALTWMLAEWDGVVARLGEAFLFTEPGAGFREPSRQLRLSTEQDWPMISVVTVSYNQRDFLENCILSVLDQRYPNLEYIVIDAGSTDGSIDILRRYEASFKHLVIEPDDGQSDGLNKGFRFATGDIMTWVNSDDMLAPLALKRAALAFAETGADIVAGTCSRVSGKSGTLEYRHHSALPANRRVPFDLAGPLDWCGSWEQGDYFFQPEVFFTRDIWERAGGYLKPHLYWGMDWELWLRCAMAGAQVVRIPDVLGISRMHVAQKTTSDEMYLWQIVNILREFDDMLAAYKNILDSE